MNEKKNVLTIKKIMAIGPFLPTQVFYQKITTTQI